MCCAEGLFEAAGIISKLQKIRDEYVDNVFLLDLKFPILVKFLKQFGLLHVRQFF